MDLDLDSELCLRTTNWFFFFSPDNYVHRLVASKTDGKLVQYECEGDVCQEEKIDALQLEVSMPRCSS